MFSKQCYPFHYSQLFGIINNEIQENLECKMNSISEWTENGDEMEVMLTELEMWANAQRDGRPVEYRWRPLFNAAKFG